MSAASPNAAVPDLNEAIRSARELQRAGGGTVLDHLLRLAGADAQVLAERLWAEGGVKVVTEADGGRPDFGRLDRQTAGEWRCVPLLVEGQCWLAADDPWDEALMQRAARRLGVQPTPAAAPGALLAAWLRHAGDGAPREAAAAGPAPIGGPVVRFVDDALAAGYAAGASDVHFEGDRAGVNVKHRIDGVLVRFAGLAGVQQAEEVISRIKVMAQLDITERRLPQDGRTRFTFDGSHVDVRVSIMPSVHGEDAVLRLLDKGRRRGEGDVLSLDELGFDAVSRDAIRDLVAQPSGMLLVTGPTGSGKTTTVYAALSEVNSGAEKLVTIEDPVEYELRGVLQIPVNDRKGLTFAKGLRSILRHDPDRILVGEIRDAETAEIAVQSALTGHQVFTTVHANSVADVIGRFRHFGMDMFGFTSALNGVVVQRLLREVCHACVRRVEPDERVRRWLADAGAPPAPSVAMAAGCEACRRTGYRSRFVVAEVHAVDDALRDLVVGGAPVSALKAHAVARGVTALAGTAAAAVAAGRTTIEEVRRVLGG